MAKKPAGAAGGDKDVDLDLTQEEVAQTDPWDLTVRPHEEAQSASLQNYQVKEYSPDEDREKVRGNIAMGLVLLLAALILLSFVSLWLGLATSADLKSILELVFTPVVALVGSATGFYFGGRSGK